MRVGLGWLLLGVSLISHAAIIGTDDRKEVYEVADAKLRTLALSSAILLHKKRQYLVPEGEGYRLAAKVKTHGAAEHLCTNERFFDEPAPGYCSAFLVAPDKVATVAHCIDPDLSNMQVVFGFALVKPGEMPKTFAKKDVYSVTSVVARGKDQDWAVLALDRPVEGREPLKINHELSKIGAPVAAIEYPSGLPLKVAGNAEILEPQGADEEIYSEAYLDVFSGASGSAVINTRTYEVEGLVAVAFGERQTGTENGKPCERMRFIPDPERSAPVWLVRASLLPRDL
jgi:hypothetical protein